MEVVTINTQLRRSQEMKKERKNKRIAVCKEISIKDEKTIYYEIDGSMKGTFSPDTYLFCEETTAESSTISAVYVHKIISDARDIEGIIKVNKNLLFRKTDCEYIFPMEEEAVQEFKSADVKQFKKLFKQTLLDLDFLIKQCRRLPKKGRRKELIDMYYANSKKFQQLSLREKNKRLKELHGIELDLYNEINIRELKKAIEKLIEDNKIINKIDKEHLWNYCIEKLDHVAFTIEPKSRARMLMDDYMGVRVDYKKKDLIWGYRTFYPIRLGFSFFWGMIKNILSLTYVPAIFLLLDNEYKISIYAMLSVVYLIALVFSDEKQMDKLLSSSVNSGESISYGTLYYYGLLVSITFILFSVEMVIMPSKDIFILLKYLLMDIVLSYAIVLVFNVVVTLFCWSITRLSATRVYRKIWKKIKGILGKVIIAIIYILGLFVCGDILGFNVSMLSFEGMLTWKFWMLAMSYMAVIIRTITLWGDVLIKEH